MYLSTHPSYLFNHSATCLVPVLEKNVKPIPATKNIIPGYPTSSVWKERFQPPGWDSPHHGDGRPWAPGDATYFSRQSRMPAVKLPLVPQKRHCLILGGWCPSMMSKRQEENSHGKHEKLTENLKLTGKNGMKIQQRHQRPKSWLKLWRLHICFSGLE